MILTSYFFVFVDFNGFYETLSMFSIHLKKRNRKKSTINHIAIGDSSYSLLDTHASRSVLWIWRYLSVCLSVCLYVCMYVCMYVHLQPKTAESGYQFFVIAHLTLVGQCPMKSLLSVSVGLSVHLSCPLSVCPSICHQIFSREDH